MQLLGVRQQSFNGKAKLARRMDVIRWTNAARKVQIALAALLIVFVFFLEGSEALTFQPLAKLINCRIMPSSGTANQLLGSSSIIKGRMDFGEGFPKLTAGSYERLPLGDPTTMQVNTKHDTRGNQGRGGWEKWIELWVHYVDPSLNSLVIIALLLVALRTAQNGTYGSKPSR